MAIDLNYVVKFGLYAHPLCTTFFPNGAGGGGMCRYNYSKCTVCCAAPKVTANRTLDLNGMVLTAG